MFGKEEDKKWYFINNEPKTLAGYSSETRTVTKFNNEVDPVFRGYKFEIDDRSIDGQLFSYRVSRFPYPFLRNNGVSPVFVVDVILYDFHTKRIKGSSSALVNGISSDTVMTGVIVLRLGDYGLYPRYLGSPEPPPELWDDLEDWCNLTPVLHFERNVNVSNGWCDLLSGVPILGTENKYWVRELKSPWQVIKSYLLHESYLVQIKVESPSGEFCYLKGMVGGSKDARRKAVMSFIETVGMTISLEPVSLLCTPSTP